MSIGDPSPTRRITTLEGAVRRQEMVIEQALASGDRRAFRTACRERERLQARIQELLVSLLAGYPTVTG